MIDREDLGAIFLDPISLYSSEHRMIFVDCKGKLVTGGSRLILVGLHCKNAASFLVCHVASVNGHSHEG